MSGERPPGRAVAAGERHVRHFAGRIVPDDGAEAGPDAATSESLGGNAGFEDLQTMPGIGPGTAAQPVASIGISGFDSHDKLASHCGLAPPTQQPGTSVGYDGGHRGGSKPPKSPPISSCNSLGRPKGRYGECMRRCPARGAKYKCALKATARKGTKVICAVMRDGVPYAVQPVLGTAARRHPRQCAGAPPRHAQIKAPYRGKLPESLLDKTIGTPPASRRPPSSRRRTQTRWAAWRRLRHESQSPSSQLAMSGLHGSSSFARSLTVGILGDGSSFARWSYTVLRETPTLRAIPATESPRLLNCHIEYVCACRSSLLASSVECSPAMTKLADCGGRHVRHRSAQIDISDVFSFSLAKTPSNGLACGSPS
ncbi:transposase [Olsenella sp. Marseille-P4559]|uniref:transposase n=1 Tax=Olsenella sp. Marseille-P4559 TaxID=2364795 RepID=UPI00103076C1